MAEEKDPQAERAEEDVEGQRRTVDEEDVEGQGRRKRADDEDDAEGHRMM